MYKNILLIDDDTDDQEIFAEALQIAEKSVVCHIANNGVEALQMLEKKTISPDLIFLDLNMPFMSGMQVLKAFKQTDYIKQIPVVVYSTSSHLTDINETKALGAIDFIIKPTKFSELCSILKAILFNK